MRPLEEGTLIPQERLPMANRSFHSAESWLKKGGGGCVEDILLTINTV